MSSTSAATGSVRTVQAVILRCVGDEGKANVDRWSSITIPADHPVFWESIPPLAARLDLPIAMHREGTARAMLANRSDLDNQWATWLNIDPESGFAPAAWQSGVGTVLIARKDRKPFLPQHLQALADYASLILDRFGDGEGPPLRLYNWQAFERWWKRYADSRKEQELRSRQPREPDHDWTSVKSPYEV